VELRSVAWALINFLRAEFKSAGFKQLNGAVRQGHFFSSGPMFLAAG
jgi:hypothetical protein